MPTRAFSRQGVLAILATCASLAVLALTAVGAFVVAAEKTFTSSLTVAESLPHASTSGPASGGTSYEQTAPEYDSHPAGSSQSPSPEPAGPKGVNILLMGSDSRQGPNSSGYGDPSVHSTERSDTTILLHVSQDRSFATAVSIPRDTWVTVPSCPDPETKEKGGGYEFKFNAAFQVGGPACTALLVEQMTGLRVDHFAVVDFTGFKRIVDELGGVEVCLSSAAEDSSSGLSLPAGTSLLNGEQALSFVRARKSLGDGSDIGRIKRQQAFLASMARSAFSAGLLLDPPRLLRLLEAVGSSLTVDRSLAEPGKVRDLAWGMRSMSPRDITFVTMPWLDRGDGENVIVDTERARALWQSMADDKPWLQADGDRKGTRASDPVTDPMSADEVRC